MKSTLVINKISVPYTDCNLVVVNIYNFCKDQFVKDEFLDGKNTLVVLFETKT